jgi:hypothetical protein
MISAHESSGGGEEVHESTFARYFHASAASERTFGTESAAISNACDSEWVLPKTG